MSANTTVGPGTPTAIRRWLTARERRAAVVLGAFGLALVVAFGVYAAVSGKAQQVEGVVQFAPSATQAQKDAVRAACPTVGKALLEPPGTSKLATALAYPLRYDFTAASAADQAAVYRCVSGQPGVVGISVVRQGD